jgi:hypothetical protein
MKKSTQLNIKYKFKSYSLSFNNKELLESIDDNIHQHPNSNVMGNGRRAWFKPPLPTIVDEIDQQLREFFNIEEDNKLIFSIYYPPEKVNGKFPEAQTTIANQKENIFTRIIICTVPEQVEITYGRALPVKMTMSSWEAYQTPDVVGPLLNYTFENKNHMQLEPRKGFRTVRRTKKIEDRHILIFDYVISNKNMEELSNLLKNIKK